MVSEEENIKDYEETIIDVDEVAGTDIKINPDYYIHSVLLKAQKSLTKDNVKDGLVQFRFLIEHAEILCKSAKRLPNDYEERIAEYKKSAEYTKQTNDNMGELSKMCLLANFKLGLMLKEVFNIKASTEPLKF